MQWRAMWRLHNCPANCLRCRTVLRAGLRRRQLYATVASQSLNTPHCLQSTQTLYLVSPAAAIKWGLDSVTFWEVFSQMHLTWPTSYNVYSSFCLVKDSWLNWIESEDLFITAGRHYRQYLIKRAFSQVDKILYFILNWSLMENNKILVQ